MDEISEKVPSMDASTEFESIDHWFKDLREFGSKMQERADFAEDILGRLQMLADMNLNLEYIAIGSQFLEIGIRELIEMYVLSINFLIANDDLYKNIKLLKPNHSDNDTLGSLIKILKTYSPNKELIDDLSTWNSLRKEVIHQLSKRGMPLSESNKSFRKSVENRLLEKISLEVLKQSSALVHIISDIHDKSIRLRHN